MRLRRRQLAGASDTISVRLPISRAAYDAAAGKALANGIRCTGTQMRIDLERYYAAYARQAARRKWAAAKAAKGGAR